MVNLRAHVPISFYIGIIATTTALAGCSGGGSTSLPSGQGSGMQATSTLRGNGPTKQASARRSSTLAGIGSYSSTVLSDKPLAYYQLSDPGVAMTDSGPNAIAGTYGSDVVHQTTPITLGATGAGVFPGGQTYDPNGYAFTAPSASLQPANVTLEAWFVCNAANTTSHDIPIVVYGTASVGVRYGLFLHGLGSNVDSLLYIQDSVGQAKGLTLYGSTKLIVGRTYHVVAVDDGTNVTTYINGIVDKTAAYPGAIDYTFPIQTGIQIGNANQKPSSGDSAQFPGTIAQVAIYGAPLSSTQIVNHFLAGQIVPSTTETAQPADAFVDSIGVNAHFENGYSTYATQFPQVSNLLVAAGIRHIRVGINPNYQGYHAEMQQLAAAGIHGSYVTSLGLTQDQVTSFPALVAPSLEAFEAPNEQDDQNNPTWISDCRTFQQNLYTWVKSNAATANTPVLGPALAMSSSYNQLGDVSSYLDFGNIHDYFDAFNPGTPGWGSTSSYGTYGSIPYNMNLARVSSGTKPIIATETGYGTTPGNPNDLDYRTDLRYLTRVFFEQYNAGVKRTYTYDFIDDGGTSPFANFGMLQSDLTPKPAYFGIKSLIGALQDPGPTFTPAPLTYQISGFTNNVHHLLMQKRNKTFVLAIWIEASGWNTSSGGDIVLPAQQVTLATASTFSAASLASMDENGNLTSAPLSWSGQQATFSITDKVSLVTLTP